MSYIYHMKPIILEGDSLIPLNRMNKDTEIYKSHIKKYIGRENLLQTTIPRLNCKWNDVVQFSALDPQIIVDKLVTIQTDLKLTRTEYFKVHINQIMNLHKAVVYRKENQNEEKSFIAEKEITVLDESYRETTKIPDQTIQFWNNVKDNGGKFLWFPFIPHIFVEGIINTQDFEVCRIQL